MIEIAQKARQVELVRALHEQYRMLLCAPAGVAPGDKEWHDTLKKSMVKIGTIKSESQIPAYCFLIFAAIKRMKGGMLLLNNIALEALKRRCMSMARVLISGVVTAKFNPDTATKRSLELNQQVMELVNMARVAAENTGIGIANEAALMEELSKLDPKKAAAKLAPTVGPLLNELDPRKRHAGNLVEWREGLNSAWRSNDQALIVNMPNEQHPTQVKLCGIKASHSWWIEVEDVRVVPEEPEPAEKADPSPTERLASLNARTTHVEDDERLFNIPAVYAGVTYSEFATSSGPSKITVGHGNSEEVKTILEALDDALFDAVIGGIDHRPLKEYLERGSLGRVSEVCIKMYGEYCGGTAQWMLMTEDSANALPFKFPL